MLSPALCHACANDDVTVGGILSFSLDFYQQTSICFIIKNFLIIQSINEKNIKALHGLQKKLYEMGCPKVLK